MKQHVFIGLLLLLVLSACHSPQREARHMVSRAERLFDTLPDSTASLIDSVLRMPVYFNEKRRMDMALLQAEALMGDRGQEIPPLMDDDFFDDKPFFSTSPELERAAEYYAKKKKYDKAAHVALYSGFVQQHYNDKAAAMQSFKDAEHYGKMVKDSLTVARAEFWIGKMLYGDGMEPEALSMLKESDNGLNNHHTEKALVQNAMGVCYMLLGDFENTELCFQQSLIHSEKGHNNKVKRRVLNNFAVLYRLQGKYNQSIDYLRQTAENLDLDEAQLFVYYLNMAKTFMAEGRMDSATVYYERIDNLLPTVKVKDETKVSAYDALFRFIESKNHNSLVLQYHIKQGNLLYDVMQERQKQNTYRIQRQYDYETLQNLLNRKILLRHRIILIISILLLLSAITILFLQHRQKKLQKSEAEMKLQIDAMKQNLRQTVKSSVMDEEITMRLRMMLTASRTTNRTNDPKKEWQPLVNQVLNGQESLFEAARVTIEMVYPNLYFLLMEKYPNLTETEAKICLLSFCDLSNAETAELLGLRLNTINQNRSTLRKKLNLSPDKMKDQLRNVLSQNA